MSAENQQQDTFSFEAKKAHVEYIEAADARTASSLSELSILGDLHQ